MPREFVLPDLGEGITEAQIISVLIKQGDQIKEDQYLMEVETDKAAVEIPSPYAGVATKVHVKEGQTVNVGAVIVTFDDGQAGAAPQKDSDGARKKTSEPAQAQKPALAGAKAAAPEPADSAAEAGKKSAAAAAPAVRKLARERGIDIDAVTGSGPGGRVTYEDIERHASQAAPKEAKGADRSAARGQPAAPIAPAKARLQSAGEAMPAGKDGTDKWGAIRQVPLSQIRKTIANQMTRSAFTAVHVTHGDEADITQLDRVRQQVNEATGDDPKLTVMTFVIRATCLALNRHPIFNSSFDEENGQIVYKQYVNMGIAVDSQRGLVVPVIRNADRLSLRQLAQELRAIADRIRSNQFAIEDLRGGTFTLTNVGALGGTFSTPIINYPEVAILGLGRTRKTPVLRNGQLAEAMILPMNLSFDHRATDGANAARFTRDIIQTLETPALFMLD